MAWPLGRSPIKKTGQTSCIAWHRGYLIATGISLWHISPCIIHVDCASYILELWIKFLTDKKPSWVLYHDAMANVIKLTFQPQCVHVQGNEPCLYLSLTVFCTLHLHIYSWLSTTLLEWPFNDRQILVFHKGIYPFISIATQQLYQSLFSYCEKLLCTTASKAQEYLIISGLTFSSWYEIHSRITFLSLLM